MLRTQKFYKPLIGFGILALLLGYGNISKAADGTLDQSNVTTDADGSLAIRTHQRIGQSFIPTKNQLAMIGFILKTQQELLIVIFDKAKAA